MHLDPDFRVLIAEDDAVSRLLVARLLTSWGYRVTIAQDGPEALAMMRSDDAPLLAILDWLMPGIDGIEVCRQLKADPARRHVYVIMLTSNNARGDLVAALDAGADDFVGKPFDADELRVRLRAGQRIVELQRDLLRRASHDELTGLFNRRMTMELLARDHSKSCRDRRPLSIAMLDIDHFKRVNDEFGHQAGDIVLQTVAARIAATVRRNDIVGRYGGEEFLLSMPDCREPSAAIIAERVRQSIAERPIVVGSVEIRTTVSIGTASLRQTETLQDLVREADEALYRAKRQGRDQVESTRQSAASSPLS